MAAAAWMGCGGTSKGDGACSGAVSFSPCIDGVQASPPDAGQAGTACNARIGFEDGTTGAFFTSSEPFDNAFLAVENSADIALCGEKSLRLASDFDPQEARFAGSVALRITDTPLPRRAVASLWIFIEAQDVTGLQAMFEAIPPSSPFHADPVLVVPGKWQRLEAHLSGDFPAEEFPAQLTLRLFSPATGWAGSLYVDEVDWR